MTKYIGVLTAGGDSPGLNAALRGLGKSAIGYHNMSVIGFRDGFRGLVENRTLPLENATLSGILTLGGTILGTSRDKPDLMPVGSKVLDMTEVCVDNYRKHHLDVLVCIGGAGTLENAYLLHKQGLNIVALPKTIDNDVWGTDVTFGFDTALGIATEAIDRLHSTAQAHHRIIIVEVMGHNTGWLALGAGVAGGADIILIPEIPYDINVVAEAAVRRWREGKRFSIIAVAEGALSKEDAAILEAAEERKKQAKKKEEKEAAKAAIAELQAKHIGNTMRLATELETMTGLESRVTILGHLQRGGTPSAADRLLATRLGTACTALIDKGQYGVLVAARGEGSKPIPLAEVAGKLKRVPLDHPWLDSARRVGTCMGD